MVYVLAATGGLEDPSFQSFMTREKADEAFDAQKNDLLRDPGDRLDLMEVKGAMLRFKRSVSLGVEEESFEDSGDSSALINTVLYDPGTGTVVGAADSLLVDLDELAEAAGVSVEEANDLLCDEDSDMQELASEVGVKI